MLTVRLQRVGRKHEPVFRLVLTDSKNAPRSGKFSEILGSFDARKEEKTQIKEDRVKYWISKGAKLSGTVHNMLVQRKVIEGKKINVLPKKRAIVTEKPTESGKPETKEEATPAEEATQQEEKAPSPQEEAPSEDSSQSS